LKNIIVFIQEDTSCRDLIK